MNFTNRQNMKTRRISVVSACLLLALGAIAQTTKEEMFETIEKTAGVYYAYPVEEAVEYTQAPDGYEPFYISHFGRHGSRYLILETDYTNPIREMERAEKAGALSELGKDALSRLRAIYDEAEGRAEDLSPLGARQHRGIAERMTAAFPEVFGDGKKISARSSIILRCAMSMAAFCDRLKELNPTLQITYESSKKYMPYLTGRSAEANAFTGANGVWRNSYNTFRDAHTNPDRFVSALFADSAYVKQYVDPKALMWQFYWVASDVQNMETEATLYDLFTKQELFDLWQCFNYQFYCTNANHADSNGAVKDSYKPLLRNIIESADEAIVKGDIAATLRFAHDSNITPLAALMGIENYGVAVKSPETLYTHWTDFKVSPMAANLQIVFYKKQAKTDGDILVKFLLNEQEVHVPVETDSFPYYKWDDVRAYYGQLAGM